MRWLALVLLLAACTSAPEPADLSPGFAATQEIEAAHPWAP